MTTDELTRREPCGCRVSTRTGCVTDFCSRHPTPRQKAIYLLKMWHDEHNFTLREKDPAAECSCVVCKKAAEVIVALGEDA